MHNFAMKSINNKTHLNDITLPTLGCISFPKCFPNPLIITEIILGDISILAHLFHAKRNFHDINIKKENLKKGVL